MFSAVVYASEESVINAVVAARTMTGADYCGVPALPQDQLQEVLAKQGILKPRESKRVPYSLVLTAGRT